MMRKLITEPTAGAKIFLGGTCKGTDWRDLVKETIRCNYFDPYIRDGEWTEAHYEAEMQERKFTCSHLLYVITPASAGFYAIAEIIEDSIQRPDNTMICFLKEDGDKSFSEEQLKSIEKVIVMVREYHSNIYDDLDSVISAINALA